MVILMHVFGKESLRVRDHPPLPGSGQVALAEAEPGKQALLVLV